MKALLHRTVKRVPRLYAVARKVYRAASDMRAGVVRRLPGHLRITQRGTSNLVQCSPQSGFRHTTLVFEGHDNRILIHDDAQLDGCSVRIRGSRNHVEIGAASLTSSAMSVKGSDNRVSIRDGCLLVNLGIVCEDDGNEVTVGARTQVHGSTELAALEGTTISVGADCLFSGGIHARTGDSHSLIDLSGRRINPSRDISIGDHVWVGRQVTMLKGSCVSSNSVVAASAVVTKCFDSPNVAIGGNPAKVIREGIDWRNERIPVD